MDRRSLLTLLATGSFSLTDGCVASLTKSREGTKITTTELDPSDPPSANARYHYDHFGIDSPESTTAVRATKIGDGGGVHEVYLHTDSDTSVQISIDIENGSEPVFQETVEVRKGTFVYYNFTRDGEYRILVSLDGTEIELDVMDEWIEARSGRRPRKSYQLFLISPGGDVDEIKAIDD